MLQCVAVCCNVLQHTSPKVELQRLQAVCEQQVLSSVHVAVCCSVLQCVAVCCSVLRVLQCVACVAVCCNVL